MRHGISGVYNISRGSRVDLLEPVKMIAEITGISGAVTYAPPGKSNERDSVADISRARETFGYALPALLAFTVKEGLIETIGWFRNLPLILVQPHRIGKSNVRTGIVLILYKTGELFYHFIACLHRNAGLSKKRRTGILRIADSPKKSRHG
jgi:hypothetical protein